MNNSMSGTSIQELYNKEKMDQYENMRKMQGMGNMQYNAMQNLHSEQGHNAAHTIQQGQHAPYYNIPNNYGYPRQNQIQPNPPSCHINPNNNYPGIIPPTGTSTDINMMNMDNMDDGNQGYGQNYGQGYDQNYGQNNIADIEDLARDITNNLPVDTFDGNLSQNDEEDMIMPSQEDDSILSKIPGILQEPIIILILYIILSQPSIQRGIGKYIKQVNPNASGRVSLTGIIIYGIILAALFALTKRFLLK